MYVPISVMKLFVCIDPVGPPTSPGRIISSGGGFPSMTIVGRWNILIRHNVVRSTAGAGDIEAMFLGHGRGGRLVHTATDFLIFYESILSINRPCDTFLRGRGGGEHERGILMWRIMRTGEDREDGGNRKQ